MKETALKIINHYGVKHQQRKFQEEVFELNEAIIIREQEESPSSYTDELEEHIAEEIADVMFMLKQFQEYYEITDEDIENVMIFKGKKKKKRMEEEDERIN